ncbi:MAG TPA: D-2-hydroxyacid dehydrogenase [Caulobacteraceae bacterium]
MSRLLIYEPSWRRIRGTLARFGEAVEPLVVDREGKITLGGEAVTPEEAQPEIAWFSGDLYQQKAAGPFVQAMLASESLKWFHSAAAGFDHPMFQRVADKGIRFSTSHGQAVGMADYVVAGVLDVFQRGPERRAAQARKEWKGFTFREVLDTTWLVIGFGAIGQGVGARAKGFGARVIGVRRNQAANPAADLIIHLPGVPAHLPEADVVVLCAPLNAETRHLANEAFFGEMKAGSVVVNVGRGALIDEAALLEALDKGIPAHAVLDVFETEPLPVDSPLWTHPRVSLTAHHSGVTGHQDDRNRDLFLDNLARYLGGRPLLHEIDLSEVRRS